MLLLLITPDISGLKFVFTMVTILEKRNSVDHFWDLTKDSVNRKRLFISSLIRKKGESQNRVSRKQSTPNFPKKRTFLTPWDEHVYVRTCAYQGVRNFVFSENLAYFVFLKYPFWDSLFSLLLKMKILPWKQPSFSTIVNGSRAFYWLLNNI